MYYERHERDVCVREKIYVREERGFRHEERWEEDERDMIYEREETLVGEERES